MQFKNWSLTCPDDQHARLSPAYDFVSTVPYIPDDQSALNFNRTRKFTGYTEDDFQIPSVRAALPRKQVQHAHRETSLASWRNGQPRKTTFRWAGRSQRQSTRISRHCQSPEGTACERPVRDTSPERPPSRGRFFSRASDPDLNDPVFHARFEHSHRACRRCANGFPIPDVERTLVQRAFNDVTVKIPVAQV